MVQVRALPLGDCNISKENIIYTYCSMSIKKWQIVKKVPHRDFYNVRKVDTHVHHSAWHEPEASVAIYQKQDEEMSRRSRTLQGRKAPDAEGSFLKVLVSLHMT